MPLVSEMTGMGRLIQEKEELSIVPDKKEGLFFSAAPQDKAAKKELLKGLGGAALSLVCASCFVALILHLLG